MLREPRERGARDVDAVLGRRREEQHELGAQRRRLWRRGARGGVDVGVGGGAATACSCLLFGAVKRGGHERLDAAAAAAIAIAIARTIGARHGRCSRRHHALAQHRALLRHPPPGAARERAPLGSAASRVPARARRECQLKRRPRDRRQRQRHLRVHAARLGRRGARKGARRHPGRAAEDDDHRAGAGGKAARQLDRRAVCGDAANPLREPAEHGHIKPERRDEQRVGRRLVIACGAAAAGPWRAATACKARRHQERPVARP